MSILIKYLYHDAVELLNLIGEKVLINVPQKQH